MSLFPAVVVSNHFDNFSFHCLRDSEQDTGWQSSKLQESTREQCWRKSQPKYFGTVTINGISPQTFKIFLFFGGGGG